jgi:hypothetical protein
MATAAASSTSTGKYSSTMGFSIRFIFHLFLAYYLSSFPN